MGTLSNGISAHPQINHAHNTHTMNKHHLILAVCALLCFAVVARLVPHAPNLTPIAAIAFIGSLYLGRAWALLLPVLALALSDLFIGFYDWRIMLTVYGSYALVGLASIVAARQRSVPIIGASVVSASILFFLTTNAAVWAFSPWYEKSIAGLLYAYELGLPFFRNMLMGDLLYTGALVALCEGVRAYSAKTPRTAIRGVPA